MSGPATDGDEAPAEGCHGETDTDVEVVDSRTAEVGRFTVRRALPRRARRTVGAWCFVDHMGPAEVTERNGLDVAPHPHIGLQTVTWLIEGEGLHRDSLGTEQVIAPGQVNLMTAGRGVAHSEEATGAYRGPLQGVQLWVAQPERTRHGDASFEHHADLPRVELGPADATVFVGGFAGVRSPARGDTDHLGVDLELRAGETVVPVEPAHEHAVVVLDGVVSVEGRAVAVGQHAYLGTGREQARLEVEAPARAILLGGTPFEEELVLWWNYVARTQDEITAAHAAWLAGDDRFPAVRSPLARTEPGPPPWVRR